MSDDKTDYRSLYTDTLRNLIIIEACRLESLTKKVFKVIFVHPEDARLLKEAEPRISFDVKLMQNQNPLDTQCVDMREVREPRVMKIEIDLSKRRGCFSVAP